MFMDFKIIMEREALQVNKLFIVIEFIVKF